MIFKSVKQKKWLLIAAILFSGVFAIQYSFGQSSGARINLHTPVSFPVDI
ncbi:MAG: hypothetical protein V7740_17615 [Pseudomonas marincola]